MSIARLHPDPASAAADHGLQRAYSVAQVAARYGVKSHLVLAWIAAGVLVARDVSAPGACRPRWKILPADLAEFDERRRSRPAPPKQPRRRRQVQQPEAAEPIGRRW